MERRIQPAVQTNLYCTGRPAAIPKDKMNIAYVCDQYWPVISGVSVSNDMFKKHLEKLGCRVYFFVPNYPGAEELDRSMGNRDVFRFRSYPLFFNRENRLVFKMEKRKLYRASTRSSLI